MGVGLIVTVVLLGAVLGVVSRSALSAPEKEKVAVDAPQTQTTATAEAAYEEKPVTSHAM